MIFSQIIRTDGKKQGVFRFCSVIAAGFCGGIINGLLGTGGGILMLLVLRKCCKHDPKSAFAASLFCTLPLSLLSLYTSIRFGSASFGDVFSQNHVPMALGAVIGGICGAKLLSRMRLVWVEWICAALLLFAGGRMILN